MSVEEIAQLRHVVNEQADTIRRLQNRLGSVLDAIAAHQVVKHNNIPVGGFHRADRALWEQLDKETP